MLNNNLRARCMEYVLILLEQSDTSPSGGGNTGLEKYVVTLEEQVKQRLNDKSEDVRQIARCCFWAFKRHWNIRTFCGLWFAVCCC